MNQRSSAQFTMVFAVLFAFSGCASIISGRRADVAFDSYPPNAHVVVRDQTGHEVAALTTPGVVSLKRNRRYFMSARYTAHIAAPGYQSAQVPIRSTINPWILGNIIVGGIPGLLVDAATGAAWVPNEDTIRQTLVPLDGPQPANYNDAGGSPSML